MMTNDVTSIGHKDFSAAPTKSGPHLEMVMDIDADEEESWINNSSSTIVADLPTNAAPLLLPNLFTCPQAYIFSFLGIHLQIQAIYKS